MRAMRLRAAAAGSLIADDDVEPPLPGPGEVRLRVRACGVCRTDLHIVDGELATPRLPVIPGHQIVGVVESLGEGAAGAGLAVGQRVGVPWLGWTCGACAFCGSGRENLCPRALFTGWTRDGGYADLVVADARYVFPLPAEIDDVACAPLLCAGLIGHRAYRLAGGAPGGALGIYGFGAAGHIVAQIAAHEGREVHAFTRPGDAEAQALAHRLGAVWAGGTDQAPPRPLDAAIIFASHGPLVPLALSHVEPGATVVCAGIHMSDIPGFPYSLLWGERVVRSVANLTRDDARALLALAARVPIRTAVTRYSLAAANEALGDLRSERLTGAAVLIT